MAFPDEDRVRRVLVPPVELVARGAEGLREYARMHCGPLFHPVGTASMVPREDGGVVDASLRVYGTRNLRVVRVVRRV